MKYCFSIIFDYFHLNKFEKALQRGSKLKIIPTIFNKAGLKPVSSSVELILGFFLKLKRVTKSDVTKTSLKILFYTKHPKFGLTPRHPPPPAYVKFNS